MAAVFDDSSAYRYTHPVVLTHTLTHDVPLSHGRQPLLDAFAPGQNACIPATLGVEQVLIHTGSRG